MDRCEKDDQQFINDLLDLFFPPDKGNDDDDENGGVKDSEFIFQVRNSYEHS